MLWKDLGVKWLHVGFSIDDTPVTVPSVAEHLGQQTLMDVHILQNTVTTFTGMILAGMSSSVLNTSRQEPKLFPLVLCTLN